MPVKKATFVQGQTIQDIRDALNQPEAIDNAVADLLTELERLQKTQETLKTKHKTNERGYVLRKLIDEVYGPPASDKDPNREALLALVRKDTNPTLLGDELHLREAIDRAQQKLAQVAQADAAKARASAATSSTVSPELTFTPGPNAPTKAPPPPVTTSSTGSQAPETTPPTGSQAPETTPSTGSQAPETTPSTGSQAPETTPPTGSQAPETTPPTGGNKEETPVVIRTQEQKPKADEQPSRSSGVALTPSGQYPRPAEVHADPARARENSRASLTTRLDQQWKEPAEPVVPEEWGDAAKKFLGMKIDPRAGAAKKEAAKKEASIKAKFDHIKELIRQADWHDRGLRVEAEALEKEGRQAEANAKKEEKINIVNTINYYIKHSAVFKLSDEELDEIKKRMSALPALKTLNVNNLKNRQPQAAATQVAGPAAGPELDTGPKSVSTTSLDRPVSVQEHAPEAPKASAQPEAPKASAQPEAPKASPEPETPKETVQEAVRKALQALPTRTDDAATLGVKVLSTEIRQALFTRFENELTGNTHKEKSRALNKIILEEDTNLKREQLAKTAKTATTAPPAEGAGSETPKVATPPPSPRAGADAPPPPPPPSPRAGVGGAPPDQPKGDEPREGDQPKAGAAPQETLGDAIDRILLTQEDLDEGQKKKLISVYQETVFNKEMDKKGLLEKLIGIRRIAHNKANPALAAGTPSQPQEGAPSPHPASGTEASHPASLGGDAPAGLQEAAHPAHPSFVKAEPKPAEGVTPPAAGAAATPTEPKAGAEGPPGGPAVTGGAAAGKKPPATPAVTGTTPTATGTTPTGTGTTSSGAKPPPVPAPRQTPQAPPVPPRPGAAATGPKPYRQTEAILNVLDGLGQYVSAMRATAKQDKTGQPVLRGSYGGLLSDKAAKVEMAQGLRTFLSGKASNADKLAYVRAVIRLNKAATGPQFHSGELAKLLAKAEDAVLAEIKTPRERATAELEDYLKIAEEKGQASNWKLGGLRTDQTVKLDEAKRVLALLKDPKITDKEMEGDNTHLKVEIGKAMKENAKVTRGGKGRLHEIYQMALHNKMPAPKKPKTN